MTIWRPEPLDPSKPIFRALADAIQADIQCGRLAPAERMPTQRELARELGVNVMTITRAYQEAARRGLLSGEIGRGTFVRGERPGPARMRLPDGRARAAIDFEQNLPAPELAPAEALEVLTDFARDPRAVPLFSGYSSAGAPDQRAAGAEWIARTGLEADPERVIICGGAQHAMSVVITALARPGDTVLCEELSYAGMSALARVLQLRVHGVAMDEEGLLPDALESACRKTPAQLLYCMPSLHNPTGRVMSARRRGEIAEVARRHGLAIVEDDAYGFLCADAPPPLVSFAPELGHYIASTSKVMTPGLRIGYLLAPSEPTRAGFDRLAARLSTIGWMPAPLMAEIATRWIRGGVADRMVAGLRAEMPARRRLFDAHFGARASLSHAASCHLWLELPEPWRSEEFVEGARRLGVALSSSEAFVVGRERAPHAVRICIGSPGSRAEVETGLERLAGLLSQGPAAARVVV